MAPIGGGPPLSSGNTFTGVAQGISYVGDHAYAYSGSVDVDDNETVLINFTIGRHYLVAQFQPGNNFTGGTDSQFKIYIDDALILSTHVASSSTGTPFEELEFIVPPFSRIKITGRNASDSGTIGVLGSVTAEVKR